MLTICEAMQRCQINGIRLNRAQGKPGFWSVVLREWTTYQCAMNAYITDDLEDAVIQGSKMRRNTTKYA